MRLRKLLLFSFLLIIVAAPAFAQYQGGDNDGSSVASVCISTLDGVGQFSFGTLTGSPTFCDNSSEGYSVSLNNPPQDIQFYWSVPADAAVISGDNTPNAVVLFGTTPGFVSVTVVTNCVSQTFDFPVTNGVCTMYRGDVDDGFSEGAGCVTTLDGVGQFSFGILTGAANFCPGSTEGFTINMNNPPADAQFYWTVPADASIISDPNNESVSVLFGTSAGTISVTVVTPCTSATFNLAVSPGDCTLYSGGIDDGFSVGPSCSTLLDGTQTINIASIIGSTSFCQFGNEGYSIQVDNAPQNTYYNWNVPADATIIQGQGTNTIIVTFGSTNGNVSVDVITDCSTTTKTIPVSSQNCIFYAGGNNDGFSVTPLCSTLLDGTPTIVVNTLVGSANFCQNGTESYSIQVDNAPANTYYNWNVPSDAVITQGQGTNTVIITFGSANGNVSVDAITDCGTTTKTMAVTSQNCQFYAGGNNDGFSVTPSCATDLNGTSVLTVTGITGTTQFCSNGNESYTVVVANVPSNTFFRWSVPSDAVILSGQGTTTILVDFGVINGNVSVDVITDCGITTPAPLAVTGSFCQFYSGGNNDGFSVTPICVTNLNGTAFTPTVAGSTTFCNFGTESYIVTAQGATSYFWTVPAGASIVSGQGTIQILVSFGNTDGIVSVQVSNACTTSTVNLPVTATNCVFYSGGNNDGFSVTTVLHQPLPIELVSFNASVRDETVYLNWETSSEHDNDFFLIERSRDGKTFESLLKVDGAGNTTKALTYQAVDPAPFHGTSYYRLSQTDYDGSITYFKVIAVKVEASEIVKLYPNPIDRDDEVNIDYYADDDGEIKISVIDPAGRATDSGMIDVKSGVNVFRFTPHFKAPGVHIVIIRSKDKVEALRLVVL